MAKAFLSISLSVFVVSAFADKFDEENYGVKFAEDCEVCKVVTDEFLMLLSESDGKSEVLETGYSIERAKKKTKYVTSELRLIETLEGLCEKLLEYNSQRHQPDLQSPGWTGGQRGQSGHRNP